MLKIPIVVIIILMAVVSVYSQDQECVLNSAKDGDMIKVHARLLAGMRIQPTTCPSEGEYSIWLMWDEKHMNWNASVTEILRDFFRKQGYDPFSDKPMLPLKRDRIFLEFERMNKEVIPDTENNVCLPYCPKYDSFTGEFEGKLLILPYPDNIKSGVNKLEGLGGIGSVRFTTRYYLNLTSILSFEAEELERADPPVEKYYENGLKYTQSIVPTGRIIRVDRRTETEQEEK